MRISGSILLIALAMTAIAPAAHAGLGKTADTVETDRVRLKARMNVRSSAGISIHQLTLDDGTVTREFVNDGKVFAVTWQGAARPNLKQLFGDYFPRFQAANTQSGPRMRRALAISNPDFVVRSGGHSGAFWGYAVLPEQVPAGFDPSSLVQEAQ